MKLKIIISAIILINYQSAYCEIVMPVFYGWYTNSKHDYEDSCFQDHYRYKNLETETTAFELAQKVLSAPERNDCQWQRVSLNPTWYHADDFPGTYDQWKELSQNSSAITQEATRSCLNLNGYEVTSISTYIFPSYRCPKGSAHSLDLDSFESGCSTKPSGCEADIVGRDLDTKNEEGEDPDKIGIKNFGHIGLAAATLDGQQVLEVLRGKQVVQLNPINDFKNKTTFWGERYGTTQKSNLEFMEGYKILMAAYGQGSCSPEYTLTWSFAPCNSGKPPKFRCDSFVYYAYLTGANIDLGYTPLLTYPVTIFNSMLNCRDQVGYSCIKQFLVPEKDQISSYVLKPAILAEQKITAIMSENLIDIKNLDRASKAYIMATDETRENKINLLWTLLLQHQSNPLKFDYLSDVLAELEPIEKSVAIIEAFQKTNDPHLKLKYLTILVSSLTIDRVNQSQNNSYNSKQFLMNLLQTNQDEDILRTIIVNYPESLMDESTYLIMSARLEEQKTQNPENFKKMVTNSNFWYQWFGLAKIDNKFNPIWFKKLFKQYSNYLSEASTPQDPQEKSLSSMSKNILKAFNFALKSREKQDKTFYVPQSIKKKNLLINNDDESYLPEEIRYTLKLFKEETAKRNAWKNNRVKRE